MVGLLLMASISDLDGQLSPECIGLCLLDVPVSIIDNLSERSARPLLSKIEHIALSLIRCSMHEEGRYIVLHEYGCDGFVASCIVES